MTETGYDAAAIGNAAAQLSRAPEQPADHWAVLRASRQIAAGAAAPGGRNAYHVTRWDDVDTVLRDSETFSSSINAEGVGRFMGPIMIALDGQEHRAHRALVAHAFRASQLVKWEQTLIVPTIMGLIDRVVSQGHAELIADVVSKFPARIICGIADLPQDDADQLLLWTYDIHRGMLDPDAGMAAAQALRDYLEPFVERRRLEPGSDLISDILMAELDGQKLSDEEVYGFLRLLLPAGSESTYRLMANVLLQLLTRPELMARVRTDRDLLPVVIEETLRRHPSLSLVSRVAALDTQLGGCPIPAGAALNVFIASANLDESRHGDPTAFDPDRPSHRHLSFGIGQHQCLGMHLARMEVRIGISAILDRLADLRLDPDLPAPAIEGYAFRAPKALHVRFTPQPRTS